MHWLWGFLTESGTKYQLSPENKSLSTFNTLSVSLWREHGTPALSQQTEGATQKRAQAKKNYE